MDEQKERITMKIWIAVLVLSAFSLIGNGMLSCVRGVQLDRNCTGHLKRAADANTVELATQELGLAVQYLNDSGLTAGYTSIVYNTPDEDIGYWHRNLTSSLAELRAVRPEATLLERTNVLMKLRETLLDHGQGGEHVTRPEGLYLYPNNLAFAIWSIMNMITTIISIIGLVVENARRNRWDGYGS